MINSAQKDPEREIKFDVAYKKLVKKLNKEEGSNMLVPEEDLVKLQAQNQLDMNVIQNKIEQF